MIAKKKHMNIRVAESDYKKIQQYAQFNGKSISALMLDAVWDQITQCEDFCDIKSYEAEKAGGTLATFTWDTVKKEAGL